MIFYSHAVEEDGGRRKGVKLLKDHLREVGDSIENKIEYIPLKDSELLPEIGYLIGIAHDFGKYTTYFQDYLLYKKEESKKHHHGFISALFAAYLVERFLGDKRDNKYLPLLAYFVVLHHHGDLNALEKDVVSGRELKEEDFLSVEEPFRSKLKTLLSQVEDIKVNLACIETEYRDLLNRQDLLKGLKAVKVEDFLNEWKNTFSRIYKLSYQLLENEEDAKRLELFTTVLLIYSLLIDGDKRYAAEVSEIERKEIPGDLVDRYRETSKDIDTSATTGINGIRNEIYKKVVEGISKIPLEKHIFTLTAPTGTGKTLASFSCALKLRARIKGYTPRIIYSLPFTSIIDQNYDEIKKTLKQLPDFGQNESAYLIKHHHLADLKYKIEDEEKQVDESLLLVESWESEVIITTFIQFLHTVIGFKNRFLKKYHNIAGSIILLDEVQNIPIEYWPLVNRVLKLLAEHLGCYIILLTATKPLIFDKEEAIELLEENEKYFEQMDRLILIPRLKEIPLDKFLREFKRLYDKEKSHLIVLNTIKSSIEFYDMLREEDEFIEKERLYYLSTNIIPKSRIEQIEKIKDLLTRGEKIIVVSTQVIEAGIDIDLDVVIRDIGPIDSIIQVAGRCNRGMGKRKGEVYVFNLITDSSSYAKSIYGVVHCGVSFQLLDREHLEESKFFDLINRYFDVVVQKKDQDASQNIWEAIKQFRFYYKNLEEEGKTISAFELIKERKGYIDAFVEMNEEARKIWKRYVRGVIKEKDFKKRLISYLSIRKDFNSYVISVPRELTVGLESIKEDLKRVPYEQLDIYYEKETGFRRIEEGTLMF